jgi:hypothetical protein
MNKEQTLKIIESSLISIASSIPVASSLASGWNEFKNHLQQKNIEEILEQFGDRLIIIEKELDTSFIKSDNFKSLILKTCFYGKEELALYKRNALGNFLANSCTIENSQDVTKNSILETLIKLSEFDIFILSKISESMLESQISMLSGKREYDTKILWKYVTEFDLIEQLKDYTTVDVLNTLEYLNSLSVIENTATRFYRLNIPEQIDTFWLDKLKILSKEKRSSEDELRLKELEIEIGREENSNYSETFEKQYGISSLGLSILRYINKTD